MAKNRVGRPPGRREDAQLTLRIEDELKARLEELASADERTVGQYVRKVLKAHLKELESVPKTKPK